MNEIHIFRSQCETHQKTSETKKAKFLPETYSIEEKSWIRRENKKKTTTTKKKDPDRERGCRTGSSVLQSYHPATEKKNQMKTAWDVIE